MNIGKNIRILRTQNQMTQEQLADQLGVSYQAVSKWENNINAPDIVLLPKIAALFNTSIDALFSDNDTVTPQLQSYMKDDNVIRIIQLRGKNIIRITEIPNQDAPPIEIMFPHDCNDRTQYFKVEVFGHLYTDSSINGDVICHKSIQCGSINGDVHAHGDIKVSELNSQRVTCNQITDCFRLQASVLECEGCISAVQIKT